MSRTSPLLVLLAFASRASAQGAPPPTFTRPERLYLNPELTIGSSRLVALGGAYVGIAEGATGFASNLAFLAQRNPTLSREWDVDGTLSYVDVPLGNPAGRDLDNDGQPDESLRSRNLLAGVAVQYHNFGLGVYLRQTYLSYCATMDCPAGDTIDVTLTTGAMAGAVAFGEDEFIAAFGIYGVNGSFVYQGESWDYGNNGYELDVLYRPRGRPYRIGISTKPQVVSQYLPKYNQLGIVAGRQLFSAIISPPVLSLGASWRLGSGSLRYNELSPAARAELSPEELDRRGPVENVPPSGPPGPWLITAQLDLIAPVEGAVPIRTFTVNQPTQSIGTALDAEPRVGVEYEAIPGWLRGRLGAFLEPSPFPGHWSRAHGTGGLEVFLFHYFQDWSLSFAFDLANRYSNVGLSIGIWK